MSLTSGLFYFMELVKINFNPEQVNLIKSQIAPKATDDELRLFLYQCKRTGLDPLARQIYAIHRNDKKTGIDKMTVQTSIDGFRVIAERSGTYAGQSEPEFTEHEGKLTCAKVRVFRFSPNGQRYEAAVGVAYWDEYCPLYNGNPTGLWAKMPHTMLSKVAEALALRKAYPQDLSGIYTGEEMNQADISDIPAESERQILRDLVYNSNLTDDEKEQAFSAIESCPDYVQFVKIQNRLEERQLSIDEIPNPSQKDINKHLKKLA